MKYYDFLKCYLREEELADIPNIVKIFDSRDTHEEYTSFWVNGTEVKNIGKVYLGSEVFDHHLLIEWANKILTNYYHSFDIVTFRALPHFCIKLKPTKQNEKARLLIKIPYDLTRVIDLSYELDKKYANDNKIENANDNKIENANDNKIENAKTTNIQFTTDTTKTKSDPVNSPTHYQTGLIETIDSIKNILGHEKFQAYCTGNVIKYLSRYREKNGLEDLKKAETYISFIIKSYEECTTQ